VLALLLLFLVAGTGATATAAEKAPHGKESPEEHAKEGEHEEHGEEGAEGHGDEHGEEGVVELTPEALAAAAIKVDSAAVRRFSRIIRATGEITLHPDRVSRVGPRIGGRVGAISAKIGEAVAAGDVLAQLSSVELGRAKADFLTLKAKLELARSNHDREKRLQSKGISSEKELLEAEAAQIEAQVELDSAESSLHVLGLSEAEIKALRANDHELAGFALRAPLAGQVIERDVTLGQMVEPSMTAFVIADLSEVWAQVYIYQKDIAAVSAGSPVTLRLDAFPDQEVQASVHLLSATLDEKSRTARAIIVLKNPGGRLRPGMFVTAEIETSEGGSEQALAVPVAAVQKIEKEDVVFIAAGERRFERREVRVGRVSGGFAEILQGLEPGARVVTDGSFTLKSELSKGEMGEGHAH
jgi:cobalt-zinc-cadmium efflux system membrane fusion protein